jgi:probable HAF family extracellular repeat protein
MKLLLKTICPVLCLFSHLSLSAAPRDNYSFVKIAVSGFTGPNSYTVANGINDNGKVVGMAGTAGSIGESFVFTTKTGKFSDISTTESYVRINNSDEIVGYTGYDGSTVGFLMTKPGSFESLLPSGSNTSSANAINNSAQVLGISQGYALPQYFLFSDGTYTTLSLPSGYPSGINKNQQIVGSTNPTLSRMLGYVFASGAVTTFSYPAAFQTFATDINDLGDIVGYFVDSSGTCHAYVYHKKQFTEINVPGQYGPSGATATGINNCGQIVGQYSTEDGSTFGFVATPVSLDTENMPEAQRKACAH